MRPGLARRLAAIAGTAALIAMGAITAACGGSSDNGTADTPTPTGLSTYESRQPSWDEDTPILTTILTTIFRTVTSLLPTPAPCPPSKCDTEGGIRG